MNEHFYSDTVSLICMIRDLVSGPFSYKTVVPVSLPALQLRDFRRRNRSTHCILDLSPGPLVCCCFRMGVLSRNKTNKTSLIRNLEDPFYFELHFQSQSFVTSASEPSYTCWNGDHLLNPTFVFTLRRVHWRTKGKQKILFIGSHCHRSRVMIIIWISMLCFNLPQ